MTAPHADRTCAPPGGGTASPPGPRVRAAAVGVSAASSGRRPHARRGMLIVVVLVIIAVFVLLGVSFAYRMDAQLLSVRAIADGQQARLAAESGLNRAILLLREHRTEIDRWYDNPDDLRRILVWAPDKPRGADSLADQEAIPGRPAWRFSVVRSERDPERNVTRLRYGMTDEAGKVNLNTANRAQLLRLFDQIRPVGVLPQELADALIDWRDSDDVMTSVYGAESDYYARLEPPYKAKNRALETVEELLMVKNFSGRILYGEDYNRNGHLDANEDDGEEGAFPPDDGDGKLDQGLLPFVTVYSWDWNSANDNKVRLDINAVQFEQLLDGCASCDPRFKIFFEPVLAELDEDTIAFIAEAQKRGHKFRSIGEIWGLQVDENGRTNYDEAWKAYAAEMKRSGAVAEEDALINPEPADEGPGRPGDGSTGQEGESGGRADRQTGESGDRQPDGRGRDAQGGRDLGGEPEPGRSGDAPGRGRGARGRDDRQSRDSGPGRGARDREDREDRRDREAAPGRRPGSDRREADQEPDKQQRRRQAVEDEEEEETEPEAGEQPPGGGDPPDDGVSGESDQPAENESQDGLQKQEQSEDEGDGRKSATGSGEEEPPEDGEEDAWDPATSITSPVGPDQMRVLLDRLTVERGSVLLGKINVNTAPRTVLMSIPGLSEQDVESILSKREQVPAAEKATTAWLVTSGALKPEVFAVVSNRLTARSIQFKIEAIGFADHVRTARRIEAVVEMRGHTAQFRYYRDLTPLGIGFPVWDDKEIDTFAYQP